MQQPYWPNPDADQEEMNFTNFVKGFMEILLVNLFETVQTY